jgi:hypothetical protein
MPDHAHVTSVEAIDAFRTSLILYVSKARPALEEVGADVTRTRHWLQYEKRLHWESEVRRRTVSLEQAKQELSRAKLSTFNRSTIVEQKAVQRAKGLLEEAQEKLARVKRWNRDFDNRVDPLLKRLSSLHTLLSQDLLKATALLSETTRKLSAYIEVPAPSTQDPPQGAPAATAESGEEQKSFVKSAGEPKAREERNA